MASSLSEISTPHVIVVIQMGGRDRERLRFETKLVEAALSGEDWAQTKICTRVRTALNQRGGHYGFIVWNSQMLAEFFEDVHELPVVEIPSDEEFAEAIFMLDPDNYLETPPLTDEIFGCECVPNPA